MEELVAYIAKSLVENKEAVKVSSRQEDNTVIIELNVAPDEMGKVIGKQGRIAKAIRTAVKAASIKENKKYIVEIV